MRPFLFALILFALVRNSPLQAPAPSRSASPSQSPAASADLAGYIASLEEPGRGEWQKPDEVIKALTLSPGETLCDVGSGPGY